MTLYRKTADVVQQLRQQLDELPMAEDGATALTQQASLDSISASTTAAGADVFKMLAKAQEKNPDKQVYGKSMVEKIEKLAEDHNALVAALKEQWAAIQPLVDAERERQAAEQAAQKAAAEQERRAKVEAARKEAEEAALKAAETARREAEEQAAAEAARAEKARQEEIARKQQEEAAAAEQAAQQKAAAERAEQQRLEAQRKAEMDKKQEAEAKAKQEAAVAAATAAARAPQPKPVFNPEGELIHLSRGRTELDSILQQCGDRQLVVVDYSAQWCGPCRMMEPLLAAWGRELAPRVVFVKVDCEEFGNRQLAASTGISAYPTFHIYRAGHKVGQVQGADRVQLRSIVDSEAQSLAPIHSGPNPAIALANAMSRMKGAVPAATFHRAAETLLAYVRNLVAHPDEPKFRRIKAGNARYKSAIGSQPAGADCMKALGFKTIMEANEEIMVLEHPSPELPRVKTLLEQAMALGAQRAQQPAASSGTSSASAAAASVHAPAAAASQAPAPPSDVTAAPPQQQVPVQPPPATAASPAASAAAADAGGQAVDPRLMAQMLAAMLSRSSGSAGSGAPGSAAVAASAPATQGAAPTSADTGPPSDHEEGTPDGGGDGGTTPKDPPKDDPSHL